MSTPHDALTGRKVLMVEDDALVAMLLEDMLDELGFIVAASAADIGSALELAGTCEADIAVLDVNVGGKPVFPVAEALAARGIPLVFATGYGSQGLPPEWRDRPTLQKPYTLANVADALNPLAG